MYRMRTWVGTGMAVLGLALGTTATANAAPTTHVGRLSSAALARAAREALRGLRVDSPGGPSVLRTQRIGGLTKVSSGNWSGYADNDSGGRTYSAVSSVWKQPAITCPTKELQVALFWVGIDGYGSSTVEQDGTLAECYEGKPYYYSWWEMYPANVVTVGSTVKVGDHIAASVTRSGTSYALKVTDSTTSGNNVNVTKTCSTCKNSSAEWIAEAPGTSRGEAPLPDFTTWSTSAATVKSGTTSGKISSFPDDEFTMVGSDNYALATPSPLTNGNAFSVTWDNSY